MSRTVISVEGLGKEYVIGGRERRGETFREMLVSSLAAPFRRLHRLKGGAAAQERFWALKDIGFEVKEGEVLGIIGRNGAGKSTLLKILSRITAPTEGRVTIHGRVSSLLEVGTGFHPELTGRENIYLNGAILGMRRREIERKFDAIVDFSGVERFLDTPVKRYSSGMAVRLAFAVAAHLEPEILIVDEVLAVGDAEFQKKCLGKMGEVSRSGRTVLFVSHNMSAVRQLCSRGVLLRSGRVAHQGDVEEAVQFYLAGGAEHDPLGGPLARTWAESEAPGDSRMKLRGVEVAGERSPGPTFRRDEAIRVALRYDQKVALPNMRFHLRFVTQSGEVAFTSSDLPARDRIYGPGTYECICEVLPNLLNVSQYFIEVIARTPGEGIFIPMTTLGTIYIEAAETPSVSGILPNWIGAVCPTLAWQVRRLHSDELDHAG